MERLAGRMESKACSNKEERERGREYRGMILTPSLYKVYMAILVEKIRKEMEEKQLI